MLEIPKNYLNLHGWETRSRAVGPGERFSIYTQGCNLSCPGCFNPDTHPIEPRNIIPVDDFFNIIISVPDTEGITIGGGESLIQEEAVTELKANDVKFTQEIREVNPEFKISFLVTPEDVTIELQQGTI